MLNGRKLLLAGVALGLAAAGHAATPTEYVAKAGAGDLYEKTSSELVLQTTKDAKVKTFANEMIADHSKSTMMVKQAAMKSGLKPMPPMLDAKKQSMITALKTARGSNRDKLYLEQQKQAHAEALALHQSYAASGSNAPLKMAAAQIVPVVQHHIEMLSKPM